MIASMTQTSRELRWSVENYALGLGTPESVGYRTLTLTKLSNWVAMWLYLAYLPFISFPNSELKIIETFSVTKSDTNSWAIQQHIHHVVVFCKDGIMERGITCLVLKMVKLNVRSHTVPFYFVISTGSLGSSVFEHENARMKTTRMGANVK